MSKVTTQIDIKYMATGLEAIIKSFDKIDPSTLSKKAQKSMQEFTGEAKTLLDNMNAAIKKGDMTEEMAKKYEKMFDKLVGPDFTNKFREVLKGVGGDFDIAFGEMTQRAAELSKEIQNIDSKITVEQKGFRGEGENLAMTNAKKQEESQKILNQLKLEEEGIDKANLSRAKDGKLPTYATLIQNQERMNTAAAGMTAEQQKTLEGFLKTGEVTKENAAAVDLLVQKMEGNLKVEEVSARLKAKSLVDAELENTLAEKKITLKELENQKQQKLNELKTTIDPIKTAQEEVEAQKQKTKQQQIYNQNQAAAVEVISTVTGVIEEKNKRHAEEQKNIRQSTAETEKNTDAIRRNTTTLGKAANQVFNYGLAFTLLRRVYRETLRTIRDLDKALTEMAIVTTMNRKEAFALADTMANLAKQTGFTTTEIAKLSTVFFRQGRALSEVIELTTVAAKAARISGISAVESANFLTSAINAFGLAADQALAVSDRFAALASQSASSYEELAVGLSKFAAQANVAGVSIDFAMGLLAKGVETTREAPETIGTALKTVIARMRELTDLGKTFEDGMDISRVETALRQVGIALRDENGQFRELEKVLTEIGMAWNTYDRNQQASIAVSLAGTRQQSRLIAIMQDFDRTLELVNISQEAAGATNAQQVEFMKSLQAATIGLQTAWQDFIRTIGETETIIGIVKGLTTFIEILTEGLKAVGFAGKNATIILVVLFAAMRSWKVLVALKTKALGFLTMATLRDNIANIQSAKTIWAKVIATKALLGPILLIIAAITLLTLGFIKYNESQEKTIQNLEKMQNEIEATNFEMRRNQRNINNVISEMQKLESLRYMTPQQEDQLENLKERLLELVDEDIAKQFREGLITWSQVLNSIAEGEVRNLATRISSTRNLLNSTIDSFGIVERTAAWEDAVEDDEVEIGDSLGFHFYSEPDKRRMRIIQSSLISLYKDTIGELSEEGNKIILDAIKNREFTPEELLSIQENPRQFLNEQLKPLVSSYEEFIGSIEFEAEKFSDVLTSFANAYGNIENLDPQIKAFVDREFSELVELSKLLEFSGEEVVGFIANIEKLNLTSTKDIQAGFRLFGNQFQDLTSQIIEFAGTLEGFSEDQALSYAFARAAQATEDLEARAWLLNQAFSQTTIEITQNLDKIQSRIQRVDEAQTKWLEGTLSAQELLRFFDENSDLFNTLEDIERFFSGSSMKGQTFNSMLEAQNNLVGELRYNWDLYHSTTDAATKSQALQQIAVLSALTTYRGELNSLTQEQHSYNASLRAYERLASMGVDTTKILTTLTQNMGAAMAATTASSQSTLNDITRVFSEQASSIEELSGNMFDYFTLVGDQLVPNVEAMVGLGDDAMVLLGMAFTSYQETLNQALDDFIETRNQSLKIEKESLDKQKKIYEDYFNALDRLESQRERKKSRENLVSQLQRLEGATDERSRRRALELRRELNDLDEKQGLDAQKEARESLLAGFDTQYTELEARWASATEIFIDELSNSGTESGNAFVTAVNSAGLFAGADLVGTQIGDQISTGIIAKLTERFGTEGFDDDDFEPITTTTPPPGQEDEDGVAELTQAQKRQIFEDQYYENLREQRSKFAQSIGWQADEDRARARNEALKMFPGFSKGGMIDFEGLAMLHGSKSAPEAVLNPMQTEMFMGLRDALEKVSFDSTGASASVNIENISISTASLNNNQDFNRAGETLAEAFRGAIQRKGITLNTNKV